MLLQYAFLTSLSCSRASCVRDISFLRAAKQPQSYPLRKSSNSFKFNFRLRNLLISGGKMATIQTKWASCADQTGGWFRLSGRGIQTKRAGLTRSLELALVVYPAARVEVSCLDGVFGRSVPSAPGGGTALQSDDRCG